MGEEPRHTKPLASIEGGVVSRTVASCLPFLSKVEHRPRARRPDFHAPEAVVTVAGLCRNLTGFATPRQGGSRLILPRGGGRAAAG
jgi:hypothetical protein